MVNDRHWLLGGSQSITTPTRIFFPLVYRNSFCYIPQCYPTDHNMVNLPKVIITSDEEWDPSI